MPDVITTPDTFYVRPAEKLLGGVEVADFPLNSSYTPSGNPIRPGMVAVLLDGMWSIADHAAAGGAFTGLFLTEINATIGDETAGGMTNPVVLQGPATVKLLPAVLETDTWATSGSDVIELVAHAGKLKLRSGSETTQPTIAHLLKVNSDGSVIIQLMAPDSDAL